MASVSRLMCTRGLCPYLIDRDKQRTIGTSTGSNHEEEKILSSGADRELARPSLTEEDLHVALQEDDPALFLAALGDVTETQGDMAQLADKTNLNRESLYKMLSERGNPELKSLDALLHALGFRLAVTANRYDVKRKT